MTENSHHSPDATQPPLPLLRPEVLRRLQAHDREAAGYGATPPGSAGARASDIGD